MAETHPRSKQAKRDVLLGLALIAAGLLILEAQFSTAVRGWVEGFHARHLPAAALYVNGFQSDLRGSLHDARQGVCEANREFHRSLRDARRGVWNAHRDVHHGLGEARHSLRQARRDVGNALRDARRDVRQAVRDGVRTVRQAVRDALRSAAQFLDG